MDQALRDMLNQIFGSRIVLVLTQLAVGMGLMPLNSFRLWLPVGVVCFAAVALAQQPYNWGNNPPPVGVFVPVFDRVWEAGLEKDPFGSVKGRFDPGKNTWPTTLAIPGQECVIDRLRPWDPPWRYTCEAKVRPDEAKQAYVSLVNLVQSSKHEWDITTHGGESRCYDDEPDSRSNGVMIQEKAGDKGLVRTGIGFTPGTIQLRWCSRPSKNEGSVTIWIWPSHKLVPRSTSLLGPQSQPAADSSINSEIATVLGSGRYSALPTAQSTQSGTPGRTTLAITNATQYSLKILASGPTEGQYTHRR